MRYILLFTLLLCQLLADELTIADFKIDKSQEKEGVYYTYSYTQDEHKVFLAVNSYEELQKAIKQKPKSLSIPTEDVRVAQDLILDRKYPFLMQTPIFAYQSLGNSLNALKSEAGKKELEDFQQFKKFLKTFPNYSSMYKSSKFWAKIKELTDKSTLCVNYKILLSWKEKKSPRTFSFVTSFEKLNEYNDYYNSLFVFEEGQFKDYKFKRFETYKKLGSSIKNLRAFRSRLSREVQSMVKYVQANGELVMRFDAQWGRLQDIIDEIDRGNVQKRRMDSLREKYKSLSRLLDDMTPDIQKMSKGMDKHTSKYIYRLNKRNDT